MITQTEDILSRLLMLVSIEFGPDALSSDFITQLSAALKQPEYPWDLQHIHTFVLGFYREKLPGAAFFEFLRAQSQTKDQTKLRRKRRLEIEQKRDDFEILLQQLCRSITHDPQHAATQAVEKLTPELMQYLGTVTTIPNWDQLGEDMLNLGNIVQSLLPDRVLGTKLEEDNLIVRFHATDDISETAVYVCPMGDVAVKQDEHIDIRINQAVLEAHHTHQVTCALFTAKAITRYISKNPKSNQPQIFSPVSTPAEPMAVHHGQTMPPQPPKQAGTKTLITHALEMTHLFSTFFITIWSDWKHPLLRQNLCNESELEPLMGLSQTDQTDPFRFTPRPEKNN